MARVNHFDKRVGITYVYESQSYYDKEKHQSRSKRKLIGKIDPVTGEMIPTGKKGRPSKNITSDNEKPDYKKLYQTAQKQLEKSEQKMKELEAELEKQKASLEDYRKRLQKISVLCDGGL